MIVYREKVKTTDDEDGSDVKVLLTFILKGVINNCRNVCVYENKDT